MENQFIRGWEVANTYKHYLLRVIQVIDYGRPDGRTDGWTNKYLIIIIVLFLYGREFVHMH